MSALPRPELAPGPQQELNHALHALHHQAGWPSLRTLAKQTGVSHTTVSKVFSTPALPTWGTLELIAEAMDGDVDHFQGLWLAASTPEPDAPPETRIAGRRTELAAVRRHLESGTGLLLVTGEAGIGKTTLVTAAAQTTDVFVAVGHCLQLSSEVPLLPVIDALRCLYERDDGQWMNGALDQCPAYVRASLGRVLPELLPDSTPSAADDDPWGLERFFSAFTALERALVAIRPLALHLEDGHWADRSTLDLLAHVARHSSGVPVIVTWRSEDPHVPAGHSEWLSQSRWTPGVDAIDIGPLTLDETAQQLQLIAGTAVEDADARLIQARSQGLPLYTAQLATVAPDGEMPHHLAELLDRRIGDLRGTAWRVASTLGVAQRSVAPTTLRAAAGLTADEAAGALHVLERRGLLQTGTEGAGLAHPLFTEAIERRLVPGEAVDVHGRLAEALSSVPTVHPGEVADHWRAAGRPDREVAPRVGAARRAGRHFAHREALEAWLRVLELLDAGHHDGDLELSDLLVDALDAAVEVGDLDAGRALAARAESLRLTALPRARVLQRVSSIRYEEGDLARAEELLDESLRLLERSRDSKDLLGPLEDRFFMLMNSGRHVEAQATLTRSLDLLVTHHDPVRLRRTLVGSMWLTMLTTHDVEASLAIGRRAMEVNVPEPDPIGDLMVAVHTTDSLLDVPAAAVRAEELARQSLQESEVWGLELSFPAVLVRSNLCWAHLRGGDTRAARVWIGPITHSSPVLNTAIAHIMLAAVELREGDVGAARERCRAADEQIRNRNDVWALAVPWVVEVELWGGHPGEALELLSQAVGPRLTSQFPELAADLLIPHARAHADLLTDSGSSIARRRSVGRDLRDLVSGATSDPFAAHTFNTKAFALSASWQAEVARLEGTATVETWAGAATAWDELARPHDAAYCRWRAAQVAVRTGQGTVAARLLKRAATDAHQHVPLTQAIARMRGAP